MKDKKFNKFQSSESHLAVILEDMRSQFKVFGEGLIDLREKHSKMNENMEFLRDEIGDVRIRMALVEANLKKLEASNSRIEDDIRVIKNNIKVKVDLEEHKMLEHRVVILEKRLAALLK